MGINYDEDELDKIPAHCLRFCQLSVVKIYSVMLMFVTVTVTVTATVTVTVTMAVDGDAFHPAGVLDSCSKCGAITL